MDKAILKKFAIESRQDLMQRMENKIKAFYIDEEFSKQQSGDVYILANNKHSLSLSKEEYDKRELLIKRINELGLEQVIEEAAYTWFNRIVAIRYMEIHDYLPLTKDNQSLGIRVLSSRDNTPDPEIMKFTNLVNPELDIEFKKEKYVELKDDNEKFKYILLLVCKKLGRVIPQVFDGVTDYIDILIPDNLLNESGFVNKIVTEVPVENYEQVEIIGWLYQYYNQNEKDRVISAKKAYKKNEIAYATQLFTPDWIVKYMVENSLGRYWVEKTGNLNITKNWKYFIKDNLNIAKQKVNPEEITFLDPCCGSGHILIYAFEVLYKIYLSVGYNKNDIPESILKNNLYGLDIDARAGQLSVLAIILKAREYDKYIFNKEILKKINVLSISESNKIDKSNLNYIENEVLKKQAEYLIDTFNNAKEIGSLLLVNTNDFTELKNELHNNMSIFLIDLKERLEPIIAVAEILQEKYNIVVTNPPYLNNKLMMQNLKKYVENNFYEEKSDLFSAFIVRNSMLGKNDAYLGFMTPYVWMFIQSYQKLRKTIINKINISSLIQLEYSALEEATVPICTFVLNNNENNIGTYFRLTDFKGGMQVQENKYLDAILNKNSNYEYFKSIKDFDNMPGNTISYWLSDNFIKCFEKNKSLRKYAEPKQGLATGENNRFIRQWYEVEITREILNPLTKLEAKNNEKKWFPYNKGGEFRKWYGNNDYVINWKNNGYDVKNFRGSVIRNSNYYFEESISWSKISSGNISFRYKPYGHIFDVSGTSIFGNHEVLIYLLALNNSKVISILLQSLSPTLNYEVGQIAEIPVVECMNELLNEKIKKITNENISISKCDWNSYEISWNFDRHPLIKHKEVSEHDKNLDNWSYKIEDAYESWKSNCDRNFKLLKDNEEELNRIFIDIYGLNDELIPEVDDKDITIRKADRQREIKSLISYSVGCMFGRYSLDEDGLTYAGGEFDESRYKKFKADSDNIIPITDELYFDYDIVGRFKKFIEVAFGKETLNENLDFIAETLGKKGTETSEETIRRYFVNDFFKDHCKTYKKRPIYWLLDSGKKNGFKALIYMHRYNENLIPKARLDYLHRIQTIYENLLSDVNYKLTTDISMSDKKEAQKRQADLNAKLQEIKEYDEKIAHIANQRISIDLDDGVKINYEKFKDILGKIK